MAEKVVDASAVFEEAKARPRAPRTIDIDRFFEYLDFAEKRSSLANEEYAAARATLRFAVKTLCELEFARQQGREGEMGEIAAEAFLLRGWKLEEEDML